MKNFKSFFDEAVKIQGVDPEEDWELADEASAIMKQVQIYVDRTKELTLVAIDNDSVVGAMYSGWSMGDEHDGHPVHVFAWDVGVHPKYQNQGVGKQLIDAIIKHYESEKHDYGEHTMMKILAVNPILANYLERKHGFQGSDVGGGQKMLYRY